MLAAERRRLETLLAEALRDLAAERGPYVQLQGEEIVEVDPPSAPEILEMLARRVGTDLSRPAWVEEQERRQQRETDARFWRAWVEVAA